MINTITIEGRLTKDPVKRYTQNQKAVTSGSIAFVEYKAGEKISHFIDFVAWGTDADIIPQTFKKGNKIVLSGRMSFREWERDDGTKVKVPEIVVNGVHLPERKKEEQIAANANLNAELTEIDEAPGDLPF